MSGETRILGFAEGVSVGTPVTTNVSALGVLTFVDDAAYVAAKGSAAAEGDMYYNTTLDTLRFFKDTAFINVVDESIILLTLNSGGNQAAADGNAGIEVDMSDATNVRLIYDSTLTSRWKIGDSGSESEIMVLGGVQTVTGAKTFSSAVNVSDATSSTNTTTGALIVVGGVGIQENLNVGGNVVITGDLTVNGTTTTVNSATLDVTDANITVNKGGNQATADSNDAGFTVEMSDATDAFIGYDSTTTSKFLVGEVGSGVEIADISSSQVITNKDIDGGTASNTSRITLPKGTTAGLDALTRKEATLVYDTDLQTIKIDNGTVLNEISGAGGGGGENFIDNGTLDVNADGYSTFADNTDLDGGSPTVTFARNTTTPLQGDGDGLFTKDAADRSTEGFVYAATDIPDALAYQVITFSFDYKTSANYADDDLKVVAYDVTNSRLIDVSAELFLKANPQGGKHYAQIQIQDTNSIRVGLEVASTSALAYTVNFDNFSFGRLAVQRGPVDISFGELTTPSSWSTNTTVTGNYWRKGALLNGDVFVSLSGAPNAASLTIDLPNGWTIDTAALSSGGDTTDYTFGDVSIHDAGAENYKALVRYNDTNTLGIFIFQANSTYISSANAVTNTLPVTFASGDKIHIKIRNVPITGWASSSMISSDFGGRVVYASGRGNGGGSVTANVTDIDWTEVNDTTGSWDGQKFTARENMFLDIRGSVIFSSNAARAINAYINGVIDIQVSDDDVTARRVFALGGKFKLNAGDELSFRSGTTSTLTASTFSHHLEISKIQTPQTMFDGAKIYVHARTNASQVIPNNTETTLVFEDVEVDTFNAYNTSTGVFTAPRTAFYFFDCTATAENTGSWTGSSLFQLSIRRIDDSFYALKKNEYPTSTQDAPNDVAQGMFMTEGQTADIRMLQIIGGNLPLVADAELNSLTIFAL